MFCRLVARNIELCRAKICASRWNGCFLKRPRILLFCRYSTRCVAVGCDTLCSDDYRKIHTMYVTSCAGGRQNMPHPLQVDLWPFDLESGARVACDVPYLFANFGLPRPLCSRLRPYVRDRRTSDRQTNVRRASSLNVPAMGAGHNKAADAWLTPGSISWHCNCGLATSTVIVFTILFRCLKCVYKLHWYCKTLHYWMYCYCC